MTSTWPLIRVGEVARIKHGFAFSGMSADLDKTLPVVVGIGNFNYSGGFRFDSTNLKRYDGDFPKEYELRSGNVLLAMTCQTPDGEILGVPGRIPEDGVRYLHNQRLGLLQVTDDSRLDEGYFFQFARTQEFNRQLYVTASGSKILHTSPGRIEDALIPLPPIAEQRAIAATLGALDGKIESNQQIIQKVLRLAQAIFDSALDKGSKNVTIDEIARFQNKLRIPLSSLERERRPGLVPYFGASGCFGFVDEAIFDENLVLVGEDGSVVREDGGPVIQYIWGPSWVNNHAHVLKGSTVSDEVLYLAMAGADVRSIVTGAVQPKISMTNLKSLRVMIPRNQSGLAQSVDALFGVLRSKTEESKVLTNLRDALSAEFFSGRSRVSEVTA